jgi:hypothetical protein
MQAPCNSKLKKKRLTFLQVRYQASVRLNQCLKQMMAFKYSFMAFVCKAFS